MSDEHLADMLKTIVRAYQKIKKHNEYTVVEGTGHVGVGSIVDLNNAKVAAALGLDMVIIASGGLGSTHDELALNIAVCHEYGVKVRGIILNRVLDKKRKMIQEYFPRALEKWGIPLIGCVPYNDFLSNPTMRDFEALFDTSLISGEHHHYRHFVHTRLVAGSLQAYHEEVIANELIITPASREDIIDAVLTQHQLSFEKEHTDFAGGMILTGRHPPREKILSSIRQVDIPVIYAPVESYDAMKMITSYIAKIRREDTPKIEKAIEVVEKNINFEALTL